MKKGEDMKKLLLTLVSTLMLSGAAWAEWVKVADNDFADYYIDPPSIQKDGNLRKVWQIQNLKQRDKEGGELSRRSREEFDCKQERRRTLSFSMHSESMTEGTTLTNVQTENQPWVDLPPNTVGRWVLKIVCAK